MNLEEILHNKMDAERTDQIKKSDQLTLGELTVLLDNVDDKSKSVVLGDGHYATKFGSWRGAYDELAIRFQEEKSERYPLTAREFYIKADGADGKEFQGYKGGMYQMGSTTPVWIANWGEMNGFIGETQGVIGIEEGEDEVMVVSTEVEYL
jgi:hypothetical protein